MPVIINGTTGITTPTYNGDVAAEYLVPVTSFKNKIINGGFDIWQRGTSIASSGATYTTDRWYLLRDSNATGSTCSQVAATNTKFTYAAKVQRDNGNSGTGNLYFAQPFETQNMAALRGNFATVSFYVKAGANFSGSNLKVYLVSGTGTNAKYWGGGFTNATALINGTAISISTTQSYQTVTTSVSVPTNATQLELSFVYTPTGTAGADDSYTIEGVQLEVGSSATSFDFRSVGDELNLCLRYYEQMGAQTQFFVPNPGYLNYALNLWQFRVLKRAAPTVSAISGATATFDRFGTGSISSTGNAIDNATQYSARASFTFGTNYTCGEGITLTSTFWQASAEL